MDEREKFYGKFLQHSTERALQAVSEAHERVFGRPLSHEARERESVVLLDGLTEFQNMRPRRLSLPPRETLLAQAPFDELLTRRIAEDSASDPDSIQSMQSDDLEAVRRLITNLAESFNSFIGEIRPDSN